MGAVTSRRAGHVFSKGCLWVGKFYARRRFGVFGYLGVRVVEVVYDIKRKGGRR